MTTVKHLLTRKDIAAMLVDVTTDQVRKSERRWGIDKARADLSPRAVRYRAAIVFAIFRARGWIA